MSALRWLAAKLQRVTSSREYIPEIDGLRFIALMPVLLTHSAAHFLLYRGWHNFDVNWSLHRGYILRILGMGWLGVPIFFVISGFVVSLPFAYHALQGSPKPKLSRYFLRRVTRIEPPYIVSMIVMFLIIGWYRVNYGHFLAGLVYLHKVIYGEANPLNIVTWSLEVEVFFYLLAPWLTKVYFVPGIAWRWALQIALICSYSYFVHFWLIPHGSHRLTETILTGLPFFMAGILFADFYVSGYIQRTGHLLWDIVGILCSIWLVYAAAASWMFYWLAPLMLVVIFASGMCGRILNRFLRLRVITIIGGMCYTAYLWHVALLTWTRGFFGRLIPGLNDARGAAVFCLMAMPLLLAATVPLYYFLEKPFMNGPGSRWLEKQLRAIANIFRRHSDAREQ